MQSINNRIVKLIEQLRISKNAFAENIGISSSLISQITTKKSNFGIEIVLKIIDKYPQINPNWLLKGIGEMWIEGTEINDPGTNENIDEQSYSDKKQAIHERMFLQKLNRDPQWTDAQKLKFEILTELKNSSADGMLNSIKTLRGKLASLIFFIHSIDGIFTNRIESDIYKNLKNGLTESEIKNKYLNDLAIIEEVVPVFNILQTHLREIFSMLSAFDKENVLEVDFYTLFSHVIRSQIYDEAAKLQDSLFILQPYLI